MENDYQPRESPWFLMSVLLLIGGLVLLFFIDFLWGVYCLAVAFFCYWRAIAGSTKGVFDDQENPIEDD